jgi:hypothetical protein
MNSVFDFNRWILYTSKHWNENKKKYLLSLGAIGGLLILWYSFLIIIAGENPIGENIQMVTYYVGLYLIGCLFASLMISDLNEGATAIHFLLLPASAFEKLLTAILFSFILFFISYTVIYYAVDYAMVKWISAIAAEAGHYAKPDYGFTAKVINVFVAPPGMGGDENFYVYILLVCIGVQSVYLLGSVYFVKYNFIKTMVSVLVVFLIFMFFVHKIIHLFMPDGAFFEPFRVYRIYNGDKGDLAVRLPEWLNTISLFLFKYTLAPVMWVVTYFRLKEKEVNA